MPRPPATSSRPGAPRRAPPETPAAVPTARSTPEPPPATGSTRANSQAQVMRQARRDLDAGQVDTDMRATPGLDAQQRALLVPGPGGQQPAVGQQADAPAAADATLPAAPARPIPRTRRPRRG